LAASNREKIKDKLKRRNMNKEIKFARSRIERNYAVLKFITNGSRRKT
jgi:hypothetical protein